MARSYTAKQVLFGLRNEMLDVQSKLRLLQANSLCISFFKPVGEYCYSISELDEQGKFRLQCDVNGKQCGSHMRYFYRSEDGIFVVPTDIEQFKRISDELLWLAYELLSCLDPDACWDPDAKFKINVEPEFLDFSLYYGTSNTVYCIYRPILDLITFGSYQRIDSGWGEIIDSLLNHPVFESQLSYHCQKVIDKSLSLEKEIILPAPIDKYAGGFGFEANICETDKQIVLNIVNNHNNK